MGQDAKLAPCRRLGWPEEKEQRMGTRSQFLQTKSQSQLVNNNVRGKKVYNWFTSALFVAPALYFYILFVIKPILQTINLSFYSWNGAAPVMTFVGLGNYIEVFRDPIFFKALGNNIIWILFTIFVPVMMGLLFAVMIMQKGVRGRFLYRLTYFMPNIVSLVAVGIIWTWMYNPEFGIINTVVQKLGASQGPVDFMGDESLVIWSLVIAGSWTCYGFNMVVFIAALQGVDICYMEVAEIEGATAFQKFRLVTVPLIKGTVVLLVVNSLIGSFKVFDLVYIMTKGGPYHSSEVISTYMFNRAFNMNDYGYGAALAMVLAVIIAVCTGIFLNRAEKE